MVTAGTIVLTVPPGLVPGPYDVAVANPTGGPQALPNGFVVCGRRDLSARLVAVEARGPHGEAASSLWRLVLDGDGEFFRPEARHQARLLLPALPSDLVVRSRAVEAGGEPEPAGKAVIELRLSAGAGSGVVILLGSPGSGVEDLWARFARAGAIDLAPLDGRSYGELRLADLADGSSLVAPRRYRFEFEDGRLTAVRTRGAGVDLWFEVDASDGSGCVTRTLASPTESTP
jgi:hypothetical protein